MKLIDILKQQAEYTRNSGVEVDIDEPMGTVNIFETHNPDCCVFLQGDEGYTWIDEWREIWEKVGDLGLDECALAQAYPYLDILAEC